MSCDWVAFVGAVHRSLAIAWRPMNGDRRRWPAAFVGEFGESETKHTSSPFSKPLCHPSPLLPRPKPPRTRAQKTCTISAGVSISMDGRGRAIDNVFVERLWRSVKYEDVYIKSYSAGRELHEGLESYFSFYNTARFHQSLNYRTPADVYFPSG